MKMASIPGSTWSCQMVQKQVCKDPKDSAQNFKTKSVAKGLASQDECLSQCLISDQAQKYEGLTTPFCCTYAAESGNCGIRSGYLYAKADSSPSKWFAANCVLPEPEV